MQILHVLHALVFACTHDNIKSYWAAQYNTWLLIKMTLKGVLFSFLFTI